jgi:hypothetical protein
MGKGADEVRRTTWSADDSTTPGRFTGTSGPLDGRDLDIGRDKDAEDIRRELDHTRAEMDETIRAIKDRLSPGLLSERALDRIWEGIRVESRDVLHAARQNPMPAALITAGLAWLIYDTLTYSRKVEYEETDFGQEQTYGFKPKGAIGSIKEKAAGVFKGTARGARNITSGVAERARHATGSIVERAREKTGSVAERARGKTGDIAGRTKEATSRLASGAKHQAEHLAHKVGDMTAEQARRAKSVAGDAVVDHPLAVCMAAFAVGTALALSLPETRKEHELMGEARDRMLDKAKERGQTVMEKAQNVAKETLATVKEGTRAEFSTSNEPRHEGEEDYGPIS